MCSSEDNLCNPGDIKECLKRQESLALQLQKAETIFFMPEKSQPFKEDTVIGWLCNQSVTLMKGKNSDADLAKVLELISKVIDSRRYGALLSNGFCSSLPLDFIKDLMKYISLNGASENTKVSGFKVLIGLLNSKYNSVQLSMVTEWGAKFSCTIACQLKEDSITLERLLFIEAILKRVSDESSNVRETFEKSVNKSILYVIMTLNVNSSLEDDMKSKLQGLQDKLLQYIHKNKRAIYGKNIDEYLVESFSQFLQQCNEGTESTVGYLLILYMNSIKFHYPKASLIYYKLSKLCVSFSESRTSDSPHFSKVTFIKYALEFLDSPDLDMDVKIDNETIKQWLYDLGKRMLDAENLSDGIVECLRIILRLLPSFGEEEYLIEKFLSLGCKFEEPSEMYCSFMHDLTSSYAKRQQVGDLIEAITKALLLCKDEIPHKSLPLPHCDMPDSASLPNSMLLLIQKEISLFGVKMALEFWNKMASLLEICLTQLAEDNDASSSNVVSFVIWLVALCLSSPTPRSLYMNQWSVQESTKLLKMLAKKYIVPLFDKMCDKPMDEVLYSSVLFLIHTWSELESKLEFCMLRKDNDESQLETTVVGLNNFSFQFPYIKEAQWQGFNKKLTKAKSLKLSKTMLVIQKYFLLTVHINKMDIDAKTDTSDEPPTKKQKTRSSDNLNSFKVAKEECEKWIAQTLLKQKKAGHSNQICLLIHYLPLFVNSFSESNVYTIAEWMWSYMIKNESQVEPVATSLILENKSLLQALKKVFCQELSTLLGKTEKPANSAAHLLSELSTTNGIHYKKLPAYLKCDKLSVLEKSDEDLVLAKVKFFNKYIPFEKLSICVAFDFVIICLVLLKENINVTIAHSMLPILNAILLGTEAQQIISLMRPFQLLQYIIKNNFNGMKQWSADENTIAIACGNKIPDRTPNECITLLLKSLTYHALQINNQKEILNVYLKFLTSSFESGLERGTLKICTFMLLSQMVKQDLIHSATDSQTRHSVVKLVKVIQARNSECSKEDESCLMTALFLVSQSTLLAFRDSKHKKIKSKSDAKVTENIDVTDDKIILKAVELAKYRLPSKKREIRALSQEFLVRAALRNPETWEKLPVQELLGNLDHSLAHRIFSMSTINEYTRFLSLQFKYIEDANEPTDIIHSLDTWGNMIEKNLETDRTIKLQETVQRLLLLLLVKIVRKEVAGDFQMHLKVLRFYKIACESLALSHYSKSLCLRLIRMIDLEKFTGQNYAEVTSRCIEVISTFVATDRSVHPNHLNALMDNVSMLVEDIIRKSDHNLNLSEQEIMMYSKLCDGLDKLTINIVRRYNIHLSDLGYFEIADIIIALQTTPPCPQIRSKIERILFHLMKKLSPGEIKYMMNTLRPSSVILLKHLLSTFSNTIMFDNFKK